MLDSPSQAHTDDCVEITSVPTSITSSGVYCFKRNIGTNISAGVAIDVQVNNVVIDLNGFVLGGLSAGPGTNATAIRSSGRRNLTVRNGTIRGFFIGIDNLNANSSGHLYEDLLLDSNRVAGIRLLGEDHEVANNRIVNTGNSTASNTATGILTVNLSNSLITGNLVSGLVFANFATGIDLGFGSAVEVTGNHVYDVNAFNFSNGIRANGLNDGIISGNRVLNSNAAAGGMGIIAVEASDRIICSDNIVSGYLTAISGCATVSGNVTP